jgi:hypothetical protein
MYIFGDQKDERGMPYMLEAKPCMFKRSADFGDALGIYLVARTTLEAAVVEANSIDYWPTHDARLSYSQEQQDYNDACDNLFRLIKQ